MCLTKINNLKAICVINVGPVWRLFWSFNLIFFSVSVQLRVSCNSPLMKLNFFVVRQRCNKHASWCSVIPSFLSVHAQRLSQQRQVLKGRTNVKSSNDTIPAHADHPVLPPFMPNKKKQTLFLENQKCCALQPCLHPVRLYCCHPIHMQYSISVVCNPIIIVVSTANSGGQLNGQLFISCGLDKNSFFFKPWGINRWLIVSMNNSTQLLTLCTMWPHSFSLVKRH